MANLSTAQARVPAPQLRFVAYVVVASTIDGHPLYSIADIIEPTSRYRGQLLRNARRTAGLRGYVLVGRSGLEWPAFEASARRIVGVA